MRQHCWVFCGTILGLALLAHPAEGIAIAYRQAPLDVAVTAYDLARKDMTPAQWDQYVENAQARFSNWHQDAALGDANRFLNDEMLNLGFSARSGKTKDLKRAVYWLALYRVFNAQPPSYLLDAAAKYRRELDELLSDFSWQKAADLFLRHQHV